MLPGCGVDTNIHVIDGSIKCSGHSNGVKLYVKGLFNFLIQNITFVQQKEGKNNIIFINIYIKEYYTIELNYHQAYYY